MIHHPTRNTHNPTKINPMKNNSQTPATTDTGKHDAQAAPKTKGRLGVTEGYISVPIYPTTNRDKPIWQVPRGRAGNGKRRSPATFRTLTEAEGYARKRARGLLQDGEVFGRISAEGLKASALVAQWLQPFCAKLGIGLDQAVREYIAAKERASAGPLAGLVTEYLALPWVRKSRVPFDTAVDLFLAEKKSQGCRPQTLLTLRHTLKPLVSLVANAPVGDITTAQLTDCIYQPPRPNRKQRTARSNKTVYCSLNNFYTWLGRNGYLRSDRPSAMDAIEAPIVPKTPPEIITVPDAKKALQVAVRDTDPEYVLLLAIAMFSGIRTDESQQLHRRHVAPGECIRVTAKIAKTRKPRSVPIQPVLDAWMRPFYGRNGLVNSRKDPLLKVALVLKAEGILWKHDWLRHSYCSYRLAQTGDLRGTAQEDGHSIEVLVDKYLKMVSPSEAEAYFALTPEACGIHDWEQRVAAFIAQRGECHQRVTRPRKNKAESINAAAPGEQALVLTE